MGTRSLTHVHEGDRGSAILVTIYRQYDGYPSGMGADIKAATNGGKMILTNGISNGFKPETHANGANELAAKLVVALKEPHDSGNVYLYRPGSLDVGEEYIYHVYRRKEGDIGLWAHTPRETIYEGALADFDPAASD